MQNSAVNLLRHIGGTAAIIVTPDEDAAEKAAFIREDAKANPVKARLPKLLRQYHKRYRNNLAEYIIEIKRRQRTAARAAKLAGKAD